MKLPKGIRLRKRTEFLRVSARHKRIPSTFIVAEVHRRQEGPARLGITVTRRFGNAPERNRFKRLVREAFRRHCHQLPSVDLVIRPRSAAKSAAFADIEQEIIDLANVPAWSTTSITAHTRRLST